MGDFPSIHNLTPLESGGVVARGGFNFQDHVAACFCISMLLDESILAVWCETHDDITLIRNCNEQEEVEYIQVKDINLESFWSVPNLCKREKGTEGSSLLEKSLAHDCVREKSSFRIVTSLPTTQELRVLTLPLTSPLRNGTAPSEIEGLREKNKNKVTWNSI